MLTRAVATPEAPAPAGPYSQTIVLTAYEVEESHVR